MEYKMRIRRASKWEDVKEVSISSIEDLMKLTEEYHADIILQRPRDYEDAPKHSLLVYDDYLE